MTQRFEQIYAEHHKAVRAYVRRRAPESVVDDVVSETFVVCLRNIDRVPPESLPWLRVTTVGPRRRDMAAGRRSLRLKSVPPVVGDQTSVAIVPRSGFAPAGPVHEWQTK